MSRLPDPNSRFFYSLRTIADNVVGWHRMVWDQGRNYRIHPGQDGQIRRAESKGVDVERMFWGFLPAGVPASAMRPLARGETVLRRPLSAAALRERRCLVLADGFYIRREAPLGPRWYFFQRPGAEPFAFAGIWTTGRGKYGETSFAILTCPANALVAQVSARMPVILGAGFHAAWLDASYKNESALTRMLQPFSPRLTEGWEVTPDLPAREHTDWKMADPIGPKLRVRRSAGF